jgi:hypothetical protein
MVITLQRTVKPKGSKALMLQATRSKASSVKLQDTKFCGFTA